MRVDKKKRSRVFSPFMTMMVMMMKTTSTTDAKARLLDFVKNVFTRQKGHCITSSFSVRYGPAMGYLLRQLLLLLPLTPRRMLDYGMLEYVEILLDTLRIYYHVDDFAIFVSSVLF